MYNWKEHGDFKKYYDTDQRRNYWVLGYFGGGPVNIMDAFLLAKEYAKEYDVDISGVKIDELLSSSRYKNFKFMYSQQNQVRDYDAIEMKDVYAFLRQ